MKIQEIKDKKGQIIMNCLVLFMLIQPFLDCKFWFTNPHLQIAGLTIPTLVRCLGIFGIGTFIVCKNKFEKRFLGYAAYLGSIAIYFLLHHMVASDNLKLPLNYQYSFMGEAFYIIRMVFPFVIIWFICINRISYEKFILCIQIVSLTIGLVIVIGNLFHISLTSYYTADMYNKMNFVEWFTKGTESYTFEELTSKGWFFMANQIGALMLLLLPINLYDFMKNQTKLSICSTISLGIAMILLGTRVATYGCLGMFVIFGIMFFFFKCIIKEELRWKHFILYVIFLVIIVCLFLKSPINNRNYSYGEVDVEGIVEFPTDPEGDNDTDVDNDINVLEHYKAYKISKDYFFNIYPYNEDTEFWKIFMEENTGKILNNREVQRLIVNRIDDLNDDIKNILLGKSYTRFTSGGLYLEQDFVIHYHTIGIIGMILLLGPWLYYILQAVCLMIKNLKFRFTFHNCTFLGAFIACVGCSLFSGHVMDELIITLLLGFVVGYFVTNVETRK